jgi:hypothetical protein
MEWLAKPQMVSSHKTQILILLVIADTFKKPAAKLRRKTKVRNT